MRLPTLWRKPPPPAVIEHAAPTGREIASTNPLASTRFTLPKWNPDSLVGKKGLNTYLDMRQDDTVRAILTSKKFDIVSAGWEIDPASDDKADIEVADFVSWSLRQVAGTIEQDIMEILSAMDFGFSITEKVWKRVDEGPWAGKVTLAALKTRAPGGFEFDIDDHGNLKPDGILQMGMGGEKRLPRDRFVVYSYQKEFDNPYGTSDLRAVYEPWFQKRLLSRYWGMYCERFGMPAVEGRYPSGTSSTQRDALYDIIRRLQADTAYIIPEDLQITFREVAAGGWQAFKSAMEVRTQQIARGLMYPDLLGLSERGDTGSRALGETQARGFLPAIAIVVMDLEETVFGEQIIRELVDWNYGIVEVYPQFSIQPLAQEDTARQAELWLQAVTAKAVRPTEDDELHLRSLLGFPEVVGEEPEEDDEPEPAPQEEGTEEMALVERPPWERRVDFEAIRRQVDELDSLAAVAVAQQIERIKAKMLSTLDRKQLTDTKNLNQVKALQVPYKQGLRETFRDKLASAYQAGRQTQADELQADHAIEPIPPEKALKFLDQKAFWITGVENEHILKGTQALLYQAMRSGERWQETKTKIGQWFEREYASGKILSTGVVQPGRVETIVRTNNTDAYANGRKDQIRDTAATDPELIPAVAYSAILDAVTSHICEHLDGKVFRVDDPDVDRLTPPNHYNCRSTWVPVFDDESYRLITGTELGQAEDLMDAGFGGNDRKLTAAEQREITGRQLIPSRRDRVNVGADGTG